MLREPDFLAETYDLLKPHYFVDADLTILAKAVLDHFKTYGSPPSKETLEGIIATIGISHDRDGSHGLVLRLLDWVHQIYNRESADVLAIKDRIRHFGRRQAVISAMNGALGLLERDKPDDGDITIEKIQKMFNDAFVTGSDQNRVGVTYSEVAPTLPEMLRNDILYGKKNKVPTGFAMIDEVLNGGLGVGEIGVIAGPPNRGKSTILTNLAWKAALHFSGQAVTTSSTPKCVVFITLEMHESDIALKLASIMSQIPANEIMTREEEYLHNIQPRLATIAPIQIKFWSPGTAAVDDVKWYISNLITIHGMKPGLVVLDYADRLRGGEDDRFKGMGVIYDSLIEIGNKFQCPVWTGSQINRAEADAKTIRSTGVAESWKKIEAADVVVTLNQNDEEYEQQLMRLYMAKVRRGKRGDTFFLRLDPARATLRVMSEDEMRTIRVNDAPKSTPAQDYQPPTPPEQVQAKFAATINRAPPIPDGMAAVLTPLPEHGS
jgi:replicative DNA helicase